MKGGFYDIATGHAILAEASDTGVLRAIPDAFVLGMVLALLYDLFFAHIYSPKHLRCAFVVRFLADLFYFSVCGVIGAVFLYRANDGILRWYLIAAGIVGAYGYRRTLGVPLRALQRRVLSAVRATGGLLWNYLLYPPLHILLRGGRRICSWIRRGIRRMFGHWPVRRRKHKKQRGRTPPSAVPQEDVYEHGCISVSDRSL